MRYKWLETMKYAILCVEIQIFSVKKTINALLHLRSLSLFLYTSTLKPIADHL